MTKQAMLTNFVSEIDQYLIDFNKTHPQLSVSQQKEKLKYEQIFLRRDHSDPTPMISSLWINF